MAYTSKTKIKLPYPVFTVSTNITVEGTIAYPIIMRYNMPPVW